MHIIIHSEIIWIWTIPEPKGLGRTTAMEAEKLNVVSEDCNSRILQEKEVKRETKGIYKEAFKTQNAIQTLDKTISNLELELAAAKAAQESIRSGAPVPEDIKMSESSGRSSATSGGILDRAIEAEDKKHEDFLRLDHVEGYLELSAKTKTYFATAVNLWDADFYIKVDDDVHVNIATLGQTLVRHRSK
ncbi:probable beta-1,3-galactosyltransferase 2 [Phaseolus vulgaris]|uniref:probable beta-1,3-galactosyltransferase 2 n=1 Tax=Phaseolus vulgaris TaxID=3885 RepID=UPI0035CAA074